MKPGIPCANFLTRKPGLIIMKTVLIAGALFTKQQLPCTTPMLHCTGLQCMCRRDYLETRNFIKTLETINSPQVFYKVPRECIKSLKLQLLTQINPENSQGQYKVPDNFQGLYKLPENSQGLYKLPENSQGLYKLPENSQGLYKYPEHNSQGLY